MNGLPNALLVARPVKKQQPGSGRVPRVRRVPRVLPRLQAGWLRMGPVGWGGREGKSFDGRCSVATLFTDDMWTNIWRAWWPGRRVQRRPPSLLVLILTLPVNPPRTLRNQGCVPQTCRRTPFFLGIKGSGEKPAWSEGFESIRVRVLFLRCRMVAVRAGALGGGTAARRCEEAVLRAAVSRLQLRPGGLAIPSRGGHGRADAPGEWATLRWLGASRD